MDEIDRALILRARERDVDAFAVLTEKLWGRFVRFARSILGGNDAEDAVQDGLLIVWKKLPGLREPEAFPAWSMRIIARIGFRRARLGFLRPLAEAATACDERSSADVQAVDVARILSLLPPRQRAVMHLTVMEGMTDTQIAATLGISAASVRSHRRRARETLSKALPVRISKSRNQK